MNNIPAAQRPKFSVAIQTEGYKKLINNTLQDPKRAQRFIASISSAVAVNPALQECDAGSILAGALLGESLNLSPSPQLGEYYLVPFEDRKNNRKMATFIIGYKGYLALAMRTGQYKAIKAVPVKRGEFLRYDPFTGDFEAKGISDPLTRETAETVGYYGFFELLNGFREVIYWTKEKMEYHASRYSKGYAAKKGYTFWEKDFDSMAMKTIYRQLLSKAPKSIDMRMALENDDSIIDVDGTADYIGGDDIKELSATIENEPIEILPPTSANEIQGQVTLSEL